MTEFERLEALVLFNLSDAVPSDRVNMNLYVESATAWDCLTSGCRAGWGTQCPALQQEGFKLIKAGTTIGPAEETVPAFKMALYGKETGHGFAGFQAFFGITHEESKDFFSVTKDGSKAELRKIWENYCANHPELVAKNRHAVSCPTPSFVTRGAREGEMCHV